MSLENLKKLKAKQDQPIAIGSSTGSAHAPMTKSDLKKEQVLSLIAQGHKPTQAAVRCGVYPQTFYGWKKKDQKFAFDIEQAVLAYRGYLLGLVKSAAEAGDWKAAKFLLERQFKDQSGEKQIFAISEAQDKKSIVIDMINQLRGVEVDEKPKVDEADEVDEDE